MSTPPIIQEERSPGLKSEKERPSALFAELMKAEAVKEEKPQKKEEEEENVTPPPLPSPFQTRIAGSSDSALAHDVRASSAIINGLLNRLVKEVVFIQSKGTFSTEILLKPELLSEIHVAIEYHESDPERLHLEFRTNEATEKLLMRHQMELAAGLKKALPTLRAEITTAFYASPTPLKERPRKKAIVKSEKIGYCPVKQPKEVS